MSEIAKLKQQVKDLQSTLENQKKTIELLKKRTLQAITGKREAAKPKLSNLIDEGGLARVELASRVKSVFLENVSHEIRSSVNGITGMTELVLESDLSKEQQLYLEMVGSSVDRLMVVVNEVLDFSKIETGELDLEGIDFNLKQSLDHDLYLLSQSADKKDINLTCTIAEDVPSFVHGDPARLVQIITNLVNNGIKFTDKGGVDIKIENGGYDKVNNLLLRFSISDTGVGIVPGEVKLIRQYFREKIKPNVALPLAIGTTGLGLTVTSQLVKLMGGEIDVESDAGGTLFWFSLPFKEVADFDAIEEKASKTIKGIEEEISYALRGAKILLAEDEYINRVLIQTILQQLGVEVTAVENGEEAVSEACGGSYQLVLMDVQMEGVDGLEATRRIRKHEKKHGGHLPVIALTALAMAGDRERCLQAGMDGYLAKPVEKKGLVEVLASFLTRRALVVDGDPVSQEVLVRGLIEAGYRVTISETWRLAMYEASLSHFDLIVFDLNRSQLAGVDAVKVIRQLEEYSGQRAKILGLNTLGEKESWDGVELDGLLTRPIKKEALLEKLGSAP